MANFRELEDKLKRVFPAEQAGVLMEVLSDARALIEGDLVRASDFNELKGIVKELAEAQKALAEAQRNTEQRVEALAERVGTLAEAQRSTELRLEVLTERVSALAEAQRSTELRLEVLTERVSALAEAQRNTELRLEVLTERVSALAEAQRNTENRLEALADNVKELAAAQRATEEEIRKLVIGLTHTRADLGGLQRSFGYMLENEAYRSLPAVMREKFGIEVQHRFLRKYVTLADGTDAEIDILGTGVRNGAEVTIIGETKSLLEGGDVDHFLQVLEGLKGVITGQVLKIFVTHMARPSVERYAQANDIQVIYTYEL